MLSFSTVKAILFILSFSIGNELKGLSLAVYNGEVNGYNYSHGFFKNLEDRQVNLVRRMNFDE